MEKEVKNWLESAQYDLETAEDMFNTGRYVYTVFMCHLALEKALKAKVEEVTGETPPRTHNLRYLIKLSDVSIPTRYPDDFAKMVESYNKKMAEDYLARTKEAFQWIRNCIES